MQMFLFDLIARSRLRTNWFGRGKGKEKGRMMHEVHVTWMRNR
jgi:hypothetical protein